MSDPQAFTAQQAADPATPAQTLADIAAQRPDLRPALASNPTAYQALLDWLAELGDPAVDAALAARGGPAPAASVPPQEPVVGDQSWAGTAPEQTQGWQPASSQPAPAQRAPFEPAPFEAAPFEPAPFEAAPFEPAPVQPDQVQPGWQSAPAQPDEVQPGWQPAPAQPWQSTPADPWQQPGGQPQPGGWQPAGTPPPAGGQPWQAYGAPPPKKKSNTALIVVLVVIGVLVVVGIGAFFALRALGDRIGEQVVGQASFSYAITGTPQDPPPGEDPALDQLWLACQGEDWGACDQLYDESPVDSTYEAYGWTCGFRTSDQSYCTNQFGG